MRLNNKTQTLHVSKAEAVKLLTWARLPADFLPKQVDRHGAEVACLPSGAKLYARSWGNPCILRYFVKGYTQGADVMATRTYLKGVA